jgi:hypothetical protein
MEEESDKKTKLAVVGILPHSYLLANIGKVICRREARKTKRMKAKLLFCCIVMVMGDE